MICVGKVEKRFIKKCLQTRENTLGKYVDYINQTVERSLLLLFAK